MPAEALAETLSYASVSSRFSSASSIWLSLVEAGHGLGRDLAEARHRPRLEAERHVHGALVAVDHGRALAQRRQRVALLLGLLQEGLLGVEDGLRLGGVALPEPEVVRRRRV